ncbi:MAG: AbrB/MazE/SpoVT family DNA-binding domain-containing protein [Xenococcaceae cyanobacterium MO_188.B19]|nr:AbrB/MazE/SpoVT family DNA-binding domain-containing protein [Xenococcaceae cyanobacterium MO_188.B19]
MKSQVGQWGNSLAVRIPKFITESLDLKANDQIIFSLEEGKIVLKPVKILEELSLDELLAEVDEPPETEVDWGKPMGNEVW